MSLVDITPLPAEDKTMDPATKQYVDLNLVAAEARSDTKLADFRATIEAYTARAEERDAAAQERDAAARQLAIAQSKDFHRRMDDYVARMKERDEAARELALAQSKDFNRRMDDYTVRIEEREAAALARDAHARRFAVAQSKYFNRRMDDFQARADERHSASEARFDRIEKRLDQIEAAIISMKKFIVGASLSTVLGVAAFNAALIQNYHAAFDSARYLSAAEQQSQRTNALLTAMEARLAAMQNTGSQTPSPP